MSDEEQGMGLTPEGAAALARLIVANHVANFDDWLLWEDLPSLGEYAFAQLTDAVHCYSLDLYSVVNNHDRMTDIDSRDLLERAQS